MNEELLIGLVAIAAIAIDVFMANMFYSVAKEKGHYDKKYFVIPLLLSLAGYILVAALPDLKARGTSISGNSLSGKNRNAYSSSRSNSTFDVFDVMDIPGRNNDI